MKDNARELFYRLRLTKNKWMLDRLLEIKNGLINECY